MTSAMLALLLAAPWLLCVTLIPLVVRRRPRLRRHAPPAEDESPLVSIIVPARNEAENISACLATLLASVYPRREIIVVDDGSVDGTTDIARIIESRSHGELRLIEGQRLAPGWIGKCWACWQGYQAARGDLLLFTDADTRHDDELLGHAVGALLGERADLVSIMPRQLMEGFWERLVQPQIFIILSLRYRDLQRVNRSSNPRDVIANGQFLLFRHEAYDVVGGHAAVCDQITEDLALAQRVREAGLRLHVAHAEELMDVRMYRSLAGIVEGWSKNLANGARQTVAAWLRPALPWVLGGGILLFWCVPAAVLLAAVGGFVGATAAAWSLLATAISLVFWMATNVRLRIPVQHAFFFPVGALVAALLFFRSAVRGGRVRWRGRDYRLDAPPADRAQS